MAIAGRQGWPALRTRRDRTEHPQQRCEVHGFALATACCGACGAGYCEECLVYPFGRRRAPYCVQCALVTAGVRRRR